MAATARILTDPAAAQTWMERAGKHYTRDRRMSHAAKAIGLMLADTITAREARRLTRRWGRFD